MHKVDCPHGNVLVFWSFTIAGLSVDLLLFVLLGLSGFLDSCIFKKNHLFSISLQNRLFLFFSFSPFRLKKISVKTSQLTVFSGIFESSQAISLSCV